MKLFRRKPKTVTVLIPRQLETDAEITAFCDEMRAWGAEYEAQNVERRSWLADRNDR